MNILGISCYYHDSSAALIRNGIIIAAAQEERFTRIKNDLSFPIQSIVFCLDRGGITIDEIDAIVYYENPIKKFLRILRTYLMNGPKGTRFFLLAVREWIPKKLLMRYLIKREFNYVSMSPKNGIFPPIKFSNHHRSHAASAFFPSPFKSAAILCIDGVGEWETASAWVGNGSSLRQLWGLKFPYSIGLFYATITQFLGFKVNSGEYKVMGLAPYGAPVYSQLMIDNLFIDFNSENVKLNMKYFTFMHNERMYSGLLSELMKIEARNEDENILQIHMDIAASLQKVTEILVMNLVNKIKSETGEKNLCLAGGIALNCVLNGVISRSKTFDKIWIQPAAGDAGSAIGCALDYIYKNGFSPRVIDASDSMKGSFLGPSFNKNDVLQILESMGIIFQSINRNEAASLAAKLISEGNVIGWFYGPMEFGPRALGARSILGDARNPKTQSRMNLKIKFRESFRPFAPIVLDEDIAEYFEDHDANPYMQIVSFVHSSRRIINNSSIECSLHERINQSRSDIPAVTHLDYSARVQSIDKIRNPRLHELLISFKKLTGHSVLVNTSFNVRGEPIVCTPRDAVACFMQSDMDYLFIEDCLISKKAQDSIIIAAYEHRHFEPD